MHDVACIFARAVVCSKDAQKQFARTSLRGLTTVLMEYKSATFNSFEKGSKLFFPSFPFTICCLIRYFTILWEI